ncbi:ATP-binding protein [Oceanicoccus sagamiensis]|uniref:Sensory/regulatory protein RpfC n=1 Tax=Oceanicoccus sagamiensis TaxID=716816 RepID=A0A1X9NGI0_9GAMM|nr:ATP-binding protein [Oceanicoccus sagamiensis]ARN73123.1 hypothetical protein BST96_02780 [Oceanicoccus sagamiensis]
MLQLDDRDDVIENLTKSLVDAAAIIQACPDAMLQSSRAGNILLSNPQAEKLFGYSKKEFSMMSVDDLVPDDMRNAHPHKRELYHTDPSVRPMGLSSPNLQAKHKDGTLIPVEIRLSSILSGNEMTFLATIRDITLHQKLLEELREAKLVAEEAVSRKAQFLANMSHEIRTPMNGVLGMAELLEAANLSDEQRDYLSTLQLSGRILLTVINDILDYSKLEEGKVILDKRVFNVRQWAKALVMPYQIRATDKVDFTITIAQAVPECLYGDDGRLQQVVGNLLNNAFKFTSRGSISLSIDLMAQNQGLAKLRFKVKDTGVGIPEAARAKIFEKFEQADRSTTREYGGTGLGLAIAKQLVELVGGTIWVESKEGRGSSVIFDLAFQLPAEETRVDEALLEDGVDLSMLKVLVVEDNAVNKKVIGGMLKLLKISYIVASNGREAVDVICQQNNSYDLILMDCEMPIMDGYCATKAIRSWEQQEGRSPNCIVALSAHVLADQKDLCEAAGMDSHMSKPLKIESLKAVLSQAKLYQEKGISLSN